MTSSSQLLPAALTARLTPAQRQKIQETDRPGRLTELAASLDLSQQEALLLLGQGIAARVLDNPAFDRSSRSIFPARLIHEFQFVPVSTEGTVDAPQATEILQLASSWPPDDVLEDWISTFTNRPIHWALAPPQQIEILINDIYGVGAGSLDDPDPGSILPATAVDLEADADAAVVRFVTEVIAQAIAEQATDIHFEPQEGELRIRYRVDGLLVPVPLPENLLRFQDAIISRLKIMARLNISEKRLPQDGRIDFRHEGSSLDIRVSTFPTIYAESISLRLLNQRKQAYTLDGIGLTPEEQAEIVRVLDYPHGLILVTGPTGSGKSTSLNAFLRKINSPEQRLVTIEDPIEYEVPGANQLQIRPEIDLTFASALRHVLRQDPDVIMVGEIRDRDTADIAIRASLTGHLVFSTLHTNDAAGALTRLTDMGVEPFLVASSVELVIAQRLVRRLCPECARQEHVDSARLAAALSVLQLPATGIERGMQLAAPAGCRACRQTGYRGRIGLFEILQPRALHDLVVRRESTKALSAHARSLGMRTLAQSGWERVKAKQTSLDEILRTLGGHTT